MASADPRNRAAEKDKSGGTRRLALRGKKGRKRPENALYRDGGVSLCRTGSKVKGQSTLISSLLHAKFGGSELNSPPMICGSLFVFRNKLIKGVFLKLVPPQTRNTTGIAPRSAGDDRKRSAPGSGLLPAELRFQTVY